MYQIRYKLICLSRDSHKNVPSKGRGNSQKSAAMTCRFFTPILSRGQLRVSTSNQKPLNVLLFQASLERDDATARGKKNILWVTLTDEISNPSVQYDLRQWRCV